MLRIAGPREMRPPDSQPVLLEEIPIPLDAQARRGRGLNAAFFVDWVWL